MFLKTEARMKNTVTFEEIFSWQQFESLVAAYFELLKDEDNNVFHVDVRSTGVGGDGGRDILVVFSVTDSVSTFERRWVVQCKFQEHAVSKSDLSNANIPSLIHEYGADGYLLVCKGRVSSTVSDMFERLNVECRFRYKYAIWDGEQFRQRLLIKHRLIQQFFPEYDEFLQSKNRSQQQ